LSVIPGGPVRKGFVKALEEILGLWGGVFRSKPSLQTHIQQGNGNSFKGEKERSNAQQS